MIEPARTRHRLGQFERESIWECHGPVWHAFYAWSDEGGWHYSTPSSREWRETAAGLNDVTAATVTHGKVPESSTSFRFTELARLIPNGGVVFGQRGDPVLFPGSVLT